MQLGEGGLGEVALVITRGAELLDHGSNSALGLFRQRIGSFAGEPRCVSGPYACVIRAATSLLSFNWRTSGASFFSNRARANNAWP